MNEIEDTKIEIIARAAAKAAAEAVVVTVAHQEVIINKIETLTTSVKNMDACFDRFKMGIGERIGIVEGKVGNPKSSVEVLESKIEDILWILRGIATPILGAIGLSIIGILSWYAFRK